MKQWLGVVTLVLSLAVLERANAFNRPEVIRAGEKLAVEIEHLDEALHNVNAPAHVIQKVHHFETTANDFVEELRLGCTTNEAWDEYQHIRLDYTEIRNEFYAHPYLLNNYQVNTEWRALRSAYRWLDHAMYTRAGDLPDAEVEAAKQFLEEHNAQ